MNYTSIGLSLTVNAIVTGLIVFKIFKVYMEVKPLYNQTFGATGGSKLPSVIFIIIESGFALFCIQLALLVANILPTQSALNAAKPITGIYTMLTVITNSLTVAYNFTDRLGPARA